jgi:hypothetical protein
MPLKKHFMVISWADPLAAAPACEKMQRLLYNAPILTPITSKVTCLRCKATDAFRRHHIETTVIYKQARHDYTPSSDLLGSPCAICRDRPNDHYEFAEERV